MTRKHLGIFVAASVSFAAGLAQAHDFTVGAIKIDHPYSRAMLPVAKVGGGYLKITNSGNDDRLVGVTSPRASAVEIHEMKMDGGIMLMREIKGGLAVPTGSTVELKPGSYHLMFMNVSQPFKEGERIKATLTFEKAGAVDVEFSVGSFAGSSSGTKHDPQLGHHGAHGP